MLLCIPKEILKLIDIALVQGPLRTKIYMVSIEERLLSPVLSTRFQIVSQVLLFIKRRS